MQASVSEQAPGVLILQPLAHTAMPSGPCLLTRLVRIDLQQSCRKHAEPGPGPQAHLSAPIIKGGTLASVHQSGSFATIQAEMLQLGLDQLMGVAELHIHILQFLQAHSGPHHRLKSDR